ncbi:GFA family protein [Paracoccus sp. M683]|uniref:GFA family protein n=1 Tax=Paracoccus sp. M683 TaxID=2594268 RepID=UPI001180E178|nr:GFA family protein [Paracoccus sp. M683]TRW99636.1 GFA family protein [Paracoccus sp. M683]
MTHSAGNRFSGSCLCGQVRFHGSWGDDPLRACHCGQCRRWSGHVWAAALPSDLTIQGEVTWFQSSARAERGFCGTCGSSLFWRNLGSDKIDVAAGCVDAPTGLQLAGHIWVEDKGDYYQIEDGLPQEGQE